MNCDCDNALLVCFYQQMLHPTVDVASAANTDHKSKHLL